MFYTSIEHLSDLYDRTNREYAFKASSPEEFAAWKERARLRLREISGINQFQTTPPNPRMEEACEEDGIRKEYWVIDTEPGISMPFWLFRPKSPNGAAVIIPHGHGGGKDGYKRMNADGRNYVVQLVERGCFAVCPDARGSGDRRELSQQTDANGVESARTNSHRELMNIAVSFGQSVIGMMVWDLMRLADFLESPDMKIERIGCTGMSGGGQQTLWFAALDDRVRVAMTSGYFYGAKEALLKQPGNCSCNFVPNLYSTMDMGDMGAMIAPRPFVIESGRNDHLNGKTGIDNVYPQVKVTRRAYELMGAADKLTHNVHDGKHEWRAIGLLDFLDRELLG